MRIHPIALPGWRLATSTPTAANGRTKTTIAKAPGLCAIAASGTAAATASTITPPRT
jgi:hypothetical protein